MSEELELIKPTKVAVEIPDRHVTDPEFEQFVREEGGGKIQRGKLFRLQAIGIKVKGAGTLMGVRGECFMVRAALWNAFEQLQSVMDETMKRPAKDKRKVADAVKITDGMAVLARQMIEGQKVMVEMESRTSDQAGHIRELPLPPENMGMAPGQIVRAGTLVMGKEIHLHEK